MKYCRCRPKRGESYFISCATATIPDSCKPNLALGVLSSYGTNMGLARAAVNFLTHRADHWFRDVPTDRLALMIGFQIWLVVIAPPFLRIIAVRRMWCIVTGWFRPVLQPESDGEPSSVYPSRVTNRPGFCETVPTFHTTSQVPCHPCLDSYMSRIRSEPPS